MSETGLPWDIPVNSAEDIVGIRAVLILKSSLNSDFTLEQIFGH